VDGSWNHCVLVRLALGLVTVVFNFLSVVGIVFFQNASLEEDRMFFDL